MNLIKGGLGAAVTQVTKAANHITITIPAGKGGALKAIGLQVKSTLETVVDAGGQVEFKNSSADWTPLELFTPSHTAVTAGGGTFPPIIYAVDKLLPGNSSVTMDFYPYDNQSQFVEAFLIWEQGAMPAKETFCKTVYPLKASAVTATARASPGTIVIPGAKGGTAKSLITQTWPTEETVVLSGGLAEFELDAFDITPCTFYTTACGVVGAAGGGPIFADIIPYVAPVPENSTYTVYFTPRDDQSQTLSAGVMWERPYGTRRV